jgi:hypothetical protein
MNINTLTQKELDNFFKEYFEIAYEKKLTHENPVDSPKSMRETLVQCPHLLEDGYRLGILGWGHTKVSPRFESDGTIHWSIKPNADKTGPRKLNAHQKKIIKRLEKWAATK